MPTKQEEKQHPARENPERQQLNVVIGKRVISILGQPGDWHRVQVRQLWEDHYRVNVLIGTDLACAKIAHSFFLVADSAGNVITSSPKITKQY